MENEKIPGLIDIKDGLNALIKNANSVNGKEEEIDDLMEEIAYQLEEYLEIIERAKKYEDHFGKLSEMNKIAIRAERFIIKPVKKLKKEILGSDE